MHLSCDLWLPPRSTTHGIRGAHAENVSVVKVLVLVLKRQESPRGAQFGNASVVGVLVRSHKHDESQELGNASVVVVSGATPQARRIARTWECICRRGSALSPMDQDQPRIGKSICRGGSGAVLHRGASRRTVLQNLPNPKIELNVPAATFFLSIL